jgi:hypothetical protein
MPMPHKTTLIKAAMVASKVKRRMDSKEVGFIFVLLIPNSWQLIDLRSGRARNL